MHLSSSAYTSFSDYSAFFASSSPFCTFLLHLPPTPSSCSSLSFCVSISTFTFQSCSSFLIHSCSLYTSFSFCNLINLIPLSSFYFSLLLSFYASLSFFSSFSSFSSISSFPSFFTFFYIFCKRPLNNFLSASGSLSFYCLLCPHLPVFPFLHLCLLIGRRVHLLPSYIFFSLSVLPVHPLTHLLFLSLMLLLSDLPLFFNLPLCLSFLLFLYYPLF